MGKVCESTTKIPQDNLNKPKNDKGNTNPNTNLVDNNNIVKNINDQTKEIKGKNDPKVKAPELKKYDPKLLTSFEQSMISEGSCQGVELITKDGKLNPDVCDNNLSQCINNGINTNIQKPISEISKSISYFDNNKNGTVLYFDPKSKTGVNSVKPILPKMISQNGKKNITNINNGSYVNVSIHDSGLMQSNCIYIPKKDNQPIPDLERIS